MQPLILLRETRPKTGSRRSLQDALVAATALETAATLLTRDRRAARTYEAVGVDSELLT